MMARAKTARTTNSFYGVLSVASILGGIALGWVLSEFNTATLPSPAEVLVRFVDLWNKGTWQADVRASLTRVLLGFGIGAGLAIPLGFLMGWYRPVRAILEPWTQFVEVLGPDDVIAKIDDGTIENWFTTLNQQFRDAEKIEDMVPVADYWLVEEFTQA